MDINDVKVPTSQAEMDALRASLREEIDESELDAVVGGNDDVKSKNGFSWTCPGCHVTMWLRTAKDGCKHMTKCPGNPYK